MRRDLITTVTFAALHFTIGFCVAYFISGSFPIAFGMALIEPAVNTVVFFLHERAWKQIELVKHTGSDILSPSVRDYDSICNLRILTRIG